jgi:hypothetical protein
MEFSSPCAIIIDTVSNAPGNVYAHLPTPVHVNSAHRQGTINHLHIECEDVGPLMIFSDLSRCIQSGDTRAENDFLTMFTPGSASRCYRFIAVPQRYSTVSFRVFTLQGVPVSVKRFVMHIIIE